MDKMDRPYRNITGGWGKIKNGGEHSLALESLQTFLMRNDLYIERVSERDYKHFHIYERRTHKLFLDDGPYTVEELIEALDVPIMLLGQVPIN